MEQRADRSPIISLDALQPHQRGIVIELAGGRGLLSRMASLGFTPGVEVVMVQNFGHGPLIVLVRGTRVALGRGEASKIRVRKMDHG